jgi:hypothetical protein
MNFKSFFFLSYLMLVTGPGLAQRIELKDDYLRLDAAGNDPLYTTYAATINRSQLYGDKAWRMVYWDAQQPLYYADDIGAKVYTWWKIDKLIYSRTGQYLRPPVVEASFPDMALLNYELQPGIRVQERMLVYSSSLLAVEYFVQNTTAAAHSVEPVPVFEASSSRDSLSPEPNLSGNGLLATHREGIERLTSRLYPNMPYPRQYRDWLVASFRPVGHTVLRGNQDRLYYHLKAADTLKPFAAEGFAGLMALQGKFVLEPGASVTFRVYKGSQDAQRANWEALQAEQAALAGQSMETFVRANEALFAGIPRIAFKDRAEHLVYLSAYNLVRSSMLKAEGQTKYNFYVFSRNPVWGWGHGHQVLHESLSMIPYVHLDAASAQNSQRVYMEQQGKDGLIAYRHGPRGPQTYPHKGMPTTSAPFFSWINWELYQVSRDKAFLREAYGSGARYINWLYGNRDTDRDGTFEWGPYGIIENVRDWYNAVFQVSKERYLDVDKEDISDELECLDLSLMVLNEINYLVNMAKELKDQKGEKEWSRKAAQLRQRINERFWDPQTGFFYHIDKKEHTFRFLTRDLKRPEIIGFLPLWARAVDKERAEVLVRKHLTNPETFWRKNGIPTLSAADEWYQPQVDQCCKWNGPVWLLWNYMVLDGLYAYGYRKEAHELTDKLVGTVSRQLSANHNFWESYSPDMETLNSPSNYIWDAIIAKMLIDKYAAFHEKTK